MCGTSPCSRTNWALSLIRLRVYVGGLRSSRGRSTICTTRAQELEASLDMGVAGIELSCALVCIKGVSDLIVTALILKSGQFQHISLRYKWQSTYQGSKVIPNLRDVWVKTDGTRVRIQSVSVLVDLIVQHADGAPEGWILSISIHSLLVRLIGLGVLLLGHVTSAQQIPALSVLVIFGQLVSISSSRTKYEVYIPALTDFSRYWMARS